MNKPSLVAWLVGLLLAVTMLGQTAVQLYSVSGIHQNASQIAATQKLDEWRTYNACRVSYHNIVRANIKWRHVKSFMISSARIREQSAILDVGPKRKHDVQIARDYRADAKTVKPAILPTCNRPTGPKEG